MKPIYEPRGAAREYGELALNIYTGCPHRCFYCFAPSVLHREREAFHTNVQPRSKRRAGSWRRSRSPAS